MENKGNTEKQAETPWLEARKDRNYPALEENKQADVVVVGGGLAGILTAYLLGEAGKKVILIERDEIGHGTTGYTTGFLNESLDTSMSDLYKIYGREDTSRVIEGHRKAIDLIEELVEKYNIECEFVRCSDFIYAKTENESLDLEHELIFYNKVGSEAEFNPDKTIFPFTNWGFLEVKNQGKFNVLKFLYAIAERARGLGVEIYEHTEAKKVIEGLVTTNMGEIRAHWIVITTYNPFNDPLMTFLRKGTYVSYILELELLNDILPEATYEDMASPYHYFRVDKLKGKTRVLIGGEDHRHEIKMDPQRNFNALYDYALEVFGKNNFKVVRKWNGPIIEPADGLPCIGRVRKDERVLYTVGFSGNGMTYSTISAMLFCDIITGAKNPLEEILDPKRIPKINSLFIKARDYLGVLAGGAIKNIFSERKEPNF